MREVKSIMLKSSNMVYKTLVVGVIVLFLSVGIQPAFATVEPKEEIIDVKPKDYLFQTIIDIANNLDIKNLLKQYNHKIFTSDYDFKGVFSKLMLRKPRLLLHVFFTKPSITYEYLDKCYNTGIEIINVLGEDKVLEIMVTIEVTNLDVLDEIDNLITNDEELSNKLDTLKEMNEKIKLDAPLRYHLFICSILTIISIPVLLYLIILELILFKYPHYLESSIFAGIVVSLGLIILPLTLLILILAEVFECI